MNKNPLEPTNIYEAISYAKHACTTPDWLDVPDGARVMRIQTTAEELKCLSQKDHAVLQEAYVDASIELLGKISPFCPHIRPDKQKAIMLLNTYSRGFTHLHNCARLLAHFGKI